MKTGGMGFNHSSTPFCRNSSPSSGRFLGHDGQADFKKGLE
jgi:hypothetical protein